MACPPDGMAILKGISAKLGNGNIMILAFMDHVELDPADPAGKKKDRSKSQYRYEGRIIAEADLQNEIASMKNDPAQPWRWPSLDTWRIGYDNEYTNARGSKWLASRAKKAVEWPTAEKILNGWKASTNDFKDSRKYETTGYTDPSGATLDITLEAMKSLPSGATFSKVLRPKRAS